MSDYKKWKQWLDKWCIKYREKVFSNGDKWLEIDGDSAETIVEFDSRDNFVRMNASE